MPDAKKTPDPLFSHSTNLVCLALTASRIKQYEEARAIYHRLLKAPDTHPEMETILLNNIAWTNLMSRRSELLDEADHNSKEAFERMPWLAEIKGTRGCTLVELGMGTE